MSIKGLPSSDKILKQDGAKQEYATVQPIGSKRHAIDVQVNTSYDVSSGNLLDALPAVQTTRSIFSTAHGASVDQKIKFAGGTGALTDFIATIGRVTANEIFFSVVLPEVPVEGTHTFSIQGAVPLRSSASGAMISGPIQFQYDGADQVVTEDTGTPANNRPLPVKLTSVSGDINITAGDLAVQLSHLGVNFDSSRIGDGTNIMGINASLEALVRDGDAITALGALLTELALKADLTETQPVSAASLPLPTGAATQVTLAALLVELALKADLTETQPVSAASLPLPAGAATQATLAALLVELALKADLSETQPVSIASQPLPTGAATQVTLASLDGKFSALGQKASATSAPVVLSTEQEAKIDLIAKDATLVLQSAKLPATIGQKAKAASLAVTLASDEDPLTSKKAVADGGVHGSPTSAVATTISAPANAEKVFLQADINNLSTIRIGLGGVAPTASVGYELLAGASVEIELSDDVEWIPESGTMKLNYMWTTRS